MLRVDLVRMAADVPETCGAPRAAQNDQEYSDAPIIHYWDDTRQIGVEFKQRVIPDFDGETAWDAFILFDRDATWATAQDHVLSWGSTVVDEEDQLFALLEELPR